MKYTSHHSQGQVHQNQNCTNASPTGNSEACSSKQQKIQESNRRYIVENVITMGKKSEHMYSVHKRGFCASAELVLNYT